jgi:hypothetical protein
MVGYFVLSCHRCKVITHGDLMMQCPGEVQKSAAHTHGHLSWAEFLKAGGRYTILSHLSPKWKEGMGELERGLGCVRSILLILNASVSTFL